MIRATMALAIGFLVLLGWSTAAAADDRPTTDRPTPAASKGKPKPLLGLALDPVTGLLTPLTESVGTTLETATKPVVTTLAPTVQATSQTVRPVVKAIQEVAKPLAPAVAPVLKTVEPVVRPVLTPVVDQVVTPVVDQVVAPTVRDVVAPIVSPTIAPVVTPVVDSLSPGPTTPVVEPIAGSQSPNIDPLIDLATDALEPAGGTTTAAAIEAGSVVPAGEGLPQGFSVARTGDDASPASGTATSPGPATTSATTLSVPAPPMFTSHHPTDHHRPATSSDLPDVPAPALPDGAPCTTSPSSTGGPFVAATAPGVETHGRSWRRLSSRAMTMAIPDGRPRPQPGFSPG